MSSTPPMPTHLTTVSSTPLFKGHIVALSEEQWETLEEKTGDNFTATKGMKLVSGSRSATQTFHNMANGREVPIEIATIFQNNPERMTMKRNNFQAMYSSYHNKIFYLSTEVNASLGETLAHEGCHSGQKQRSGAASSLDNDDFLEAQPAILSYQISKELNIPGSLNCSGYKNSYTKNLQKWWDIANHPEKTPKGCQKFEPLPEVKNNQELLQQARWEYAQQWAAQETMAMGIKDWCSSHKNGKTALPDAEPVITIHRYTYMKHQQDINNITDEQVQHLTKTFSPFLNKSDFNDIKKHTASINRRIERGEQRQQEEREFGNILNDYMIKNKDNPIVNGFNSATPNEKIALMAFMVVQEDKSLFPEEKKLLSERAIAEYKQISSSQNPQRQSILNAMRKQASDLKLSQNETQTEPSNTTTAMAQNDNTSKETIETKEGEQKKSSLLATLNNNSKGKVGENNEQNIQLTRNNPSYTA